MLATPGRPRNSQAKAAGGHYVVTGVEASGGSRPNERELNRHNPARAEASGVNRLYGRLFGWLPAESNDRTQALLPRS